jgi:uncharacterized protein YdaU (DUF1376 family)
MNYYRRFVGSYKKKTSSLNMTEDGAYTRLLDVYYATEKPLDPAKVNTIARAMTPAERRAVASVVEQYFYLGDDGRLHNEKADEELGVAIPKLEKLREVAQVNGKKGGRPKGSGKKTSAGSSDKPNPVISEPNPVSKNNPNESNRAHLKHPSTFTHQPTTPSDNRFPGDGDSPPPDPAATAEGSQIQVNPVALAKIVEECERAKVEDAGPDNQVIARWLRNGATPTQVIAACAEARKSMPFPKPMPIGYVDRILAPIMEADRRARANAETRHEGTKAQIAEQSTWKTSPPTEAAARFMPKKAASA